MTDLADGMAATLPCPSCAAEVPIETAVVSGFDCPHCGAALPDRPDYAIEGAASAVEVVRAYGAYGYTEEFAVADAGEGEGGAEALVCPGCGRTASLDDIAVDGRRTADPAAGPSGQAEVLAVRCPACRTAGTAVLSTGGPEVRARA
jgi:hypothetical protein